MRQHRCKFEISWASEWHLRIRIDTDNTRTQATFIREVFRVFKPTTLEGLINIIPGYQTVMLEIAPDGRNEADIESIVRRMLDDLNFEQTNVKTRLVEIPVCYDEALGPDLADVARLNQIDIPTVIRLHTSATYHVHFIGFAPGFGYLTGLPEALATPRLDTPRIRVPAGSVGIAGTQTGVYPTQSAGGWRLIGRTPRVMFDPARCHPLSSENPSTFLPGDRVRFVAIDRDEYERQTRGVVQA